MSDFPPNDWRRAATADVVGANNADAEGSTPDDELLPFAAPHGMPVLPRYGRNGESAAPASTPAPTLEPPAQGIPASAISDLPTARVSAAPPMPVAPSVSDLPTTHLPSAGGSSAPTPTPASDVSDLPTQRVKA